MTKLFRNDSPGAQTLEQARENEIKRHRALRRQAAQLSAQGRGEDTEIAHVARGEFVIPRALQTPELIAILRRAAEAKGIAFERLRVGSQQNGINPATGVSEFASPTSPPYRYEGPIDPGISVTGSRLPPLAQLPQNVPNSGYYNYGTPGNGRAQYGSPEAVDLARQVAGQWHETGAAPFGIGNMSYEDGRKFIGPDGNPEHAGHMTGGQIDIRPVRRDGRQEGLTFENPAYDREATQRLVDMWRATGAVKDIYFNDPQIRGVSKQKKHDDHIHVEIDPQWKRQ